MEEERYTYTSSLREQTYAPQNNPYITNPAPAPVKAGRKKGGSWKKALAGIALGGLFGASAAGAFYGVIETTGTEFITKYVKTENSGTASDSTVKDVRELKSTVSAIEKALVSKSNAGDNGVNLTTMTATDVSDVVDAVMPSMVAVTNNYEQQVTSFWGRSYIAEGEGSGSGIIVGESDTDYFIATNHHVIDRAKKLTVQFVDETTAEAYVKGSDANRDIAVIAVSKSSLSADTLAKLQVAKLGDSDDLKMGEPAIAIGNALGYGQSVTTGVISALGRNIENSDGTTAENLIQTSAAINPGNSGGALLNIQGEVIGINSSKIGGTNVDSMGFAIPIDEVKGLFVEYSERETKTMVSENERGYLGIQGTRDDYSAMGFPKGAFVVEVFEGTAAAEAGITKFDTITAVDGQTVTSLEELQSLLQYYKAGETVEITLQRVENGKLHEIKLNVTLGERPAD